MEQVTRDVDDVLENGADDKTIDSSAVVADYTNLFHPKLIVHSEEAFKKALRLIFSSEKTRRIVNSIKSIADAYAD